MHTVQPEEDPDQAGEGITVFAESTDGGNAVYIPSNPVLVSTLFSAGIGPVFENETDDMSGFPYRGVAGITELDAVTKDEYKPQWKEYRKRELIKIYGSEEKVLEEIIKETDFKSIEEYLDYELYEKSHDENMVNSYSGIDDWSIPTTNESGESNRNLFAGYTLRDGNVLPELIAVDAAGQWTGTNQLGMQAVKQELMAGHGVSITFCADTSSPNQKNTSDYINTTNWAHYTYKRTYPNHGVCIVGWDDEYPASNFTHPIEGMDDETAAKLTTPLGNGAWIAKNSWGCVDSCGTAIYDESQVLGVTNWGVDGSGFFYISYYDQSLYGPESFSFDDDLDGDLFYAHVYDYLPSTANFYELSSSQVISNANVFTAEHDEQVVSVSTRCSQPNSRVTFALYQLNDDASNPTDGTFVESQSYDIAYKGYHRFDLTEPLLLKEGQKFSVLSTVSTLGEDGERVYSIAASLAFSEENALRAGSPYYGTSVVHEGESYYFNDGEWCDWSEYLKSETYAQYSRGNVSDNFSIKAYALPWDDASYACTSGDGATWTQGSTDGLPFTYEETVKHGQPRYSRATVDGNEIDLTAVVIGDDNMVITLPSDYLSALAEGGRTIIAYFEDGDPVTATFTIVAADQPADDPGDGGSGSNPGGGSSGTGKKNGKRALARMGDSSNMLPAAFALGSGCALIATGLYRRKREGER